MVTWAFKIRVLCLCFAQVPEIMSFISQTHYASNRTFCCWPAPFQEYLCFRSTLNWFCVAQWFVTKQFIVWQNNSLFWWINPSRFHLSLCLWHNHHLYLCGGNTRITALQEPNGNLYSLPVCEVESPFFSVTGRSYGSSHRAGLQSVCGMQELPPPSRPWTDNKNQSPGCGNQKNENQAQRQRSGVNLRTMNLGLDCLLTRVSTWAVNYEVVTACSNLRRAHKSLRQLSWNHGSWHVVSDARKCKWLRKL